MADTDDWVRREMPDVPRFIAYFRKRPGLFGGKSVRLLDALLFGIRLAEDFHAIPAADRFGGFDFEAFEAWVARQYNPEEWTLRSFGLAEELAGPAAAGFDRWFEWYDAFNAAEDRG